jgi:hypothetical protein
MNPPLRIRISRRSRARWQAAEHVLDERPAATATSPELSGELRAMHALAQMLERIPEPAWVSELGPVPEPRAAGSAAQAPRRRRQRGWLSAGAGLVAAAGLAAAFLAGSFTHPLTGGSSSTASPVARVVLKPVPGTGSSGLAVADMLGTGGHMRLSVRQLPRLRPGTYYELWLMTSPTDLVSVASFRVGPSGSGKLNLVLPDDPAHYRYLDISVQRVGGGQAISGRSVLRGAIPD